MKILYVITSLYHGGAETQLMRMIKHLKKDQDNKIKVVALINPEYRGFIDEFDRIGIDLTVLNMNPFKSVFMEWIEFFKIIKEFRPDVVHSHMIHANIMCRLTKMISSKYKLINTVHGEEEFLKYKPLVYRCTNRFVDYTTLVGERLYAQAVQSNISSESKLKVIYNGLDIKKYKSDLNLRLEYREKYNILKSDFVWITVGRVNKIKNHRLLFEALKIQFESGSKSKFFIVGDGDLKDDLENEIKSNDELRQRIFFLGRRFDTPELLNMADGFVLTSNHEGLPLVLQEAASVGLPIVSTNVGGCDEIVINDKNGYLVNKNDANNLANALNKIENMDESTKKSMKDFSMKIIESKFNIEKIMEEWMSLYSSKNVKKG